jgi:hypothetical protein
MSIACRQALAVGLAGGPKRKAEGHSARSCPGPKGIAAPGGQRNVKARFLDDLLGDDDSNNDEEDGEASGDGDCGGRTGLPSTLDGEAVARQRGGESSQHHADDD